MAKTPQIRLDKLLASMGYGSRADIAALARAGRIALDHIKLRDATQRLAHAHDLAQRLTVHGEPLDPLAGLVIVLNKPLGMTCSHAEAGPLVYDTLPDRWRRRDPAISTVGRLDKQTSGLLLLTDDGGFLHRVISPKRHVAKTYLATLARPLMGHEAALFASGELMLDGETKPLAPAQLTVLAPTQARLTITEGRYHQVRRMFAAAGNHVEALHRETLGGLSLPPSLNLGEWRLLSEAERAAIFA